MPRLRRSDFANWDLPRRRPWHALHHLLWIKPEYLWRRPEAPATMAWWLKRGNLRGCLALQQRLPPDLWCAALRVLHEEATHPLGHQARVTVQRLTKMSPTSF